MPLTQGEFVPPPPIYMQLEMKVDFINPNILRELAQRFPESAQKARKRFRNFDKWLAGEDYPTYNQLVQLSKIFDVPFGDFFLERLPEIHLPFEGGSKNFQDAVKHAQKVQNWAREILLEFGHESLPFAGKCRNGLTLLKEAVHSGLLLHTDLANITKLSLKKLLSVL